MGVHRVTIKDVAKQAAVSISTASLALNMSDKVSEKTRKRILDVAKDLNYYGNASARSLRASKSRIIGLIIPDITNMFFSSLLEILRVNIEQLGYFLLIGITGNKVENEKKYVFEFISRNVDGVICIPMIKHVEDTSHILEFEEHGIPTIFLSAAYPKIKAPCVMCDLARGSYEITTYLIDKGLRRMAMIAGDRLVDKLNISGFRQAFIEKNLEFEENTAIYECDFSFESAIAITEKILEWKPQAILAISDLMACAAINAIRSKQLNVPNDISVAGYDDALYATISQIPITTVHQPIAEMCKRATHVIVDMIENDAREYGLELLEPHLVIRDSTI